MGVAGLGLCADAKQAAEAKAEVERLEKELKRLRGLIGSTARSNAVAADLKVCPDGHKTLKNVRISYGTPSFAPAAQKAREAAIARFEYWPGGCVFSSDSPTNRVTCTTCGLGFDTEFNSWSGYGPTITRFSRPFSAPILNFPIPSTIFLASGPTYHQVVKDGQVQSESLSYNSREKTDEAVKRVDDWFLKEGLHPAKRSQGNQASSPPITPVNWEAERLSVELRYFGNEGTTGVYIFNHRSPFP